MTFGPALLSWSDLAGLFGHFLLLSLLAIGGAMSTVSDMHRYVVVEHAWLDDAGFTASIALAQAAPGPNLLFVAVLGLNVGGPAGVIATMLGTLIPSTTLAFAASRWARERRDTLGVRAFVAGLAPITLGLLLATSYILSEPFVGDPEHRLGALALMGITLAVMLRTRWSPMWLIGLGAVAGALGLA